MKKYVVETWLSKPNDLGETEVLLNKTFDTEQEAVEYLMNDFKTFSHSYRDIDGCYVYKIDGIVSAYKNGYKVFP